MVMGKATASSGPHSPGCVSRIFETCAPLVSNCVESFFPRRRRFSTKQPTRWRDSWGFRMSRQNLSLSDNGAKVAWTAVRRRTGLGAMTLRWPPPVVQPHVEQEQARATVENRMPALGSAVYRDVALTGSLQSTFPFYGLRSSFLRLGGAPQPADPAGQLATAGWRPGQLATAGWRRNAEIFRLDEDGVVLAVKKSDGSEATTEEKMADAGAWAVSFSQDFFRNHCINHEHDCNDTCVKYVKRKLEAKESLRSHKTPSCRFGSSASYR